jgi:hypothetical protein
MVAYLEDQPKQPRRVAVALHVQKNLAERRAAAGCAVRGTPRLAWARSLCHSDRSLSPLFRHGMARQFRGKMFERIAASNEAGAFLQYLYKAAAYDKVWGELFVPPGFAERAARFYEALLAQEP